MVYKIGSRKEDLSSKKITKIASGEKGDVYRYKGEAIKIFNPYEEKPMTQETAQALTTIQTSRILLPRRLVFYDDAFCGYTLRLVHKKGNSKRIITMPGDNLIQNTEVIEEDIKKLSDKKVLLNGITHIDFYYLTADKDKILTNGEMQVKSISIPIDEIGEWTEIDQLGQE